MTPRRGGSEPPRTNVPSGTYAIRVDEEQEIWRLQESDDPFSDDLDWEVVGKRAIDAIPRSDYKGGRWESGPEGEIWFYVEEINPQTEPEPSQQQLNDTAPFSLRIEGSKGTQKCTGSTQADAWGDAVEFLIENYGLAEELEKENELPYVFGYKNAFLAREPRNPDGSEMRRHRAIADEDFYVSTSPTKEQKRESLEDFAEITGANIVFGNGWDNDE